MSSIDDVIADIARTVEAEVTRLTLNVHAELTAASPVDTGFLRANFQPSVGAPADGTVAIGSSPDVAAVVAYKLRDGSAFVTNNAEYAAIVNGRGAHVGFVEAAIDRATSGGDS